MTYVVHNYSSASWSGSVGVDVYLSTNDNISTADNLIQTHSISGSVGAWGTQTVTLTNPPTIPIGTVGDDYYIGIILNSADANTGNNDTDGQDADQLHVNPAPPMCSVTPTNLSFSVSQIGQSASKSFTISNTGGGTLSGTITESCSEFSVSPTGYSLGAGGSQTFTVTYTPTNCGNDNCVINTGPAICADVSCSATGPSTPVCAVTPSSLSFNVSQIGQSDVKQFRVQNTGCGVLSGMISESCPEFTVSGPALYSLGPGEYRDFVVTYTPANCGNDNCLIDTGPAICADVACSATGPSAPICDVSTTSLSFAVAEIGQSQSRSFTITNAGCGTMTGTVSESCPEFTIAPSPGYSLAPGASKTYTVTYTPVDCGNDNCTIDLGPAICADVACTATGPSSPVCAVEPTSLDFGTVPMGHSGSEVFRITNEGCGTLSGTVTETCPEFSVDSPSYSLAPGEFKEFTVTYTPVDVGPDNCTLSTGTGCSPVECTAVGDPTIILCLVSPNDWDYGFVEVGDYADGSFEIRNDPASEGPLVGEVTETCDHYSIISGGGAYSLEPGEIWPVTVRFEPTEVGYLECAVFVGAPMCDYFWAYGEGVEPSGCDPCDFVVTEDSYSILIEAATLESIPLEVGDQICVYDGDLCVGGVTWTGDTPIGVAAWQDDSETPELDGFACGNPISFRLIKADGCVEVPFAYLNWTTGNGTFCDGTFATVEIDFVPAIEKCLDLHGGWNWLSLNVDPGECGPAEVFADCASGLSIVKARNGNFWIPGVFDGIGCMNFLQGYKAYLDPAVGSCANCVVGEPIDPSTPIPMAAGWNWISYLPNMCCPPELTLASIWSDLQIIKNEAGQFCIPDLFCGIPAMCEGQGFSAYVTSASTLVYEPCTTAGGSEPGEGDVRATLHPTRLVPVGPTADYQAVLVEGMADRRWVPEVGDEIGVLVEGLCVGSIVWSGDLPLGLSVWIDDPRTEAKDGFEVGDELQLVVWDKSEGRELPATAVIRTGGSALGDYPLIVLQVRVGQDSRGTTDIVQTDGSVATHFSIRHQPNPATTETLFLLALPEGGPVSVDIYNTSGRKVRSLVHTTVSAGHHSVTWDGRDDAGRVLDGGVYFYRFETPVHVETQKLIFIR